MIKEINQQKRRETTDIKHFINNTIYSVLGKPSLDLLLQRECATGRISEDLISLVTWGGDRRESETSTEISTGTFLNLIPCNFLQHIGATKKPLGKNNSLH